jgi:hypothetical protein
MLGAMVRGLLVAMAAVALLCAPTAGADVPVGPGPTQYAVQEQPAPGTCHYRGTAIGETLPDPACRPGAINPKVTPDTLASTICRKGYTTSIRPPKAITNAEKRASAAAYGYTGSLADVEYDHLLSGDTTLSDRDCAGQYVGGMPPTIANI